MKYNLIVACGGLIGVAAAVSAAREGIKFLIVEKSGCLGEAAGIAATISHKTNTTAHTVNIKALQQKLKENGAVL